MAAFNMDGKIRKWKYVVSGISLIIPGEDTITISNERMSAISIAEDFETLYFPLFKISIVLESDMYYKIIEHKNECQLHLRIDRYFHDVDKMDKSVLHKFINSNFDLILDEATEDLEYSLDQESNKMDYNTKTTKDIVMDNIADDVVANFYLFNSKTISGTKINVNKILTKCNMVDAIAWLATVAKFKNVLMAQPDNREVQDEIVIPRTSILKAIEFLDSYYGLFKDGSMIYYGLNYIYIIPYNGNVTAYTKDEIVDINMVVPKGDNLAHASTLGELYKEKEDKKRYIVCDMNTLNIQNASISSNYLSANDIESVDSLTGDIEVYKSDATSKEGNFVKAYENRTENKYVGSTYTAQTSARAKVITVIVQDFNIMDIAPNKQYTFLFEDPRLLKKHKGKYILANANHTFTKEGEEFSLSSTLTFKISTRSN